MKNTMEVLVLIDFESAVADELTLRTGDVIKKVAKSSEEGWLVGELRGKRGVFPANFVQEVPVYLIGDSKREPRSVRKSKRITQTRKCEVLFAYAPMNEDELGLVVGDVLEIIKEIEDGWWMGMKNGKVGAFPSNFVKEIFVAPKDSLHGAGKARPKLTDAVFQPGLSPQATQGNKENKAKECCQVMFDYKAKAEDELDLKKGEVVVLRKKETEDDGWWEGELNGRCGFFPDNFVMLIPPTDILQSGPSSLPPARSITTALPAAAPAMDKASPAKINDDKHEVKDLRTNPPTKVKLPAIPRPSPPPVKEKPNKVLPKISDDVAPLSPKQVDEKDADHFDGLDVHTDKLSHPTANRAKPPQRRPPTGQTQNATVDTEPEKVTKTPEKLPGLQKGAENLLPSATRPEPPPKTPPPVRPAPPKVLVDGRATPQKEKPTVESLHAEVKELRMALELLQSIHLRDMQEVKEELQKERNKHVALQEEVNRLKLKY